VDGDRDRWAGPPRDWLDDLDDEPTNRRAPHRSRRLLVLAGLPWLVVLAALALANVPGPSEPSSPDRTDQVQVDEETTEGAGTDHTIAATSPDEAASADDTSTWADRDTDPPPPDRPAASVAPPPSREDELADELLAVEYHGPWRPTAGAEEAMALAVVVARAWLTDVDPRLELDGLPSAGTGRYVEHLVVEAVELPAPEHAVVTLLAVLLEGEEELTAVVRRLAVPVAFDGDGAQPGGTPWWLPEPSLAARPPSTTPVEDLEELLAATEALHAAGYTDVALERLERTDGPAALATVTARTPDGETVDGTVWLRRHLDRYVVTGLALTRAEAAS
jgi:hypothetical protein